MQTNTVLPLVFDDSLSYLEQVARLQKAQQELQESIANNLDIYISDWIDQHYDDLLMNASYNSDTESIILSRGNTNE